jgi:hypothetical protein
VLTFIEFPEELERSHQTIVLPAEEVERLVARFGPSVRQIGVWHHATDGSLELPAANIAEAAASIGNSVLSEAVRQLKNPEDFAGMLNRSCAAARLIEELGRLHVAQFEEKVRRYQDAKEPAEVQKLASEISAELFGA